MELPATGFVRELESDNYRNYVRMVEQIQLLSPENFITELLKYHPDADYDEMRGRIHINTDMINTVFRYMNPEDGCYIFNFDSYSPIDIHYHYLPNPDTDFLSIALNFIEERDKFPLHYYTAAGSHATDNLGHIFNNLFSGDLYIKAHQKAFGIRIELDRNWIRNNINERILPPKSVIDAILKKQKENYFFIDVFKYRSVVQDIKALLERPDNALRILQVKNLCSQLIADLFTDVLKNELSSNNAETTSGGELEKALLIISECADGDFPGIERLAAACNLSPRTFITRFNSVFHNSPYNYYKKIKMEYACTELKRGVTVKSVAHKAGYKNTASFCRAFKQVYGESPMTYLKPQTV
ncbi:helix-turn-helix transcriptional regulator [Pseudopedobacter beijingensis]|uniref:Helix-turn-helix transcriptional regulator n=1 Tax=Pseudopedobacter beijingensis TaxID=1207056 RepID=A0ABW4I859_9SPHI